MSSFVSSVFLFNGSDTNNNNNLVLDFSGSDNFLTSFFCLSSDFFLIFMFTLVFSFFLYSNIQKKLNITHLNVLCLIFFGNLYLNFFHPVVYFFCFSNMFYCDGRIFFFKFFFTVVAFFYVWLIRQRVKMDFLSYDFFFLLFLVLLSMQWLFSVNNFIYFYLLIELISLAAYVLASFDVFSAKSTEAGLKYFVVGSLASIFLLFSISFFYGVFGTITFSDMYLLSSVILSESSVTYLYNLIVFSVTLFVGSLLFKLGLAPLHLWLIDVYSGLNYTVFSFFSIFYKYIFFFLLYKFFVYTFFFFFTHIYYIVIIFAISSIFVGCFGAFITDDIRKILAYSSINHGGFLCLSLLNLSSFGYFSFIFYLFVYSYLLFFLFFIFFKFETLSNARALDSLSDLSAIKGSSGGSALALVTVLFSMAGIPPFVGFFSKFFVFFNLFQYFFSLNFFLVFLFLFLSGISIFVYLRMIAFVFFDFETYVFQFNFKNDVLYNVGLFVFSLLNFFCLFFFYLFF